MPPSLNEWVTWFWQAAMLIYFGSFSVMLKWLCLFWSESLIQYLKIKLTFSIFCIITQPRFTVYIFRGFQTPGCKSVLVGDLGRGHQVPCGTQGSRWNWWEPDLTSWDTRKPCLTTTGFPAEFLLSFLSFTEDCLPVSQSVWEKKKAIINSSQFTSSIDLQEAKGPISKIPGPFSYGQRSEPSCMSVAVRVTLLLPPCFQGTIWLLRQPIQGLSASASEITSAA